MKKRKTVNLSFELLMLQGAVEGARVLCDCIRSGGCDDASEARRAMGGISGILNLVGVRLRDVGRVVGGYVDPASIFAQHNDSLGLEGDGQGQEIILKAWSRKQRERWFRRQLQVVKSEMQSAEARKKPGKKARAGPTGQS